MSNETKNKTVKILLIIGVVLLIGTGITFLALHKREKNLENELETVPYNEDIPTSDISNGEDHIRKMQRFLLELGQNNSNTIITDAIQLTGGVDGIRGAGFNTALEEAIERGYLESFNDLSNQVS